MKILLTGGCGYIGTNLTNALLDLGHKVTVVDIMWFGNYLNSHKNLRIIQVLTAIRVFHVFYELPGNASKLTECTAGNAFHRIPGSRRAKKQDSPWNGARET